MDSKLKVYISGPMTGCPDWNFPAFHKKAAELREAGLEPVNPAENFDGQTDLPRELYMKTDIGQLLLCDRITFLPGWQGSRGAAIEALVAIECGIKPLEDDCYE
jgi:hypothetical protein|tara:strand:+ start:290 stop:601 length:312 start_codon:yes stop_codon:yes gene_type:complete